MATIEDNIYSLYHEWATPTAIEISVRANFTSPTENNLIVAKTSYLEIFSLNPGASTTFDPSTPHKHALTRRGHYPLFGDIIDLKVVRLQNKNKDCLLLSFKNAKMVIVEFDEAVDDIVVGEHHIFCFDDRKQETAERFDQHYEPHIRVDPQSRCAVMKIFDKQLEVFPFRQDSNQQTTKIDTYTINLAEMGIFNVKDFQFLDGYHEPTLLILYEKTMTFPGRYAVSSDTCSVISLSLNLWTRTASSITTVHKMPESTYKITPIPARSGGGALIFSANIVFHFDTQTLDSGLSLNEFGDKYKYLQLGSASDVCTMESVQCAWLAPSELLVSCLDGQLYLLAVIPPGQGSNRISLNYLGSGPPPTTATTMDGNYCFIGSRLASSVLIKYRKRNPEEYQTSGQQEPQKRRKTQTYIVEEDELAKELGGSYGQLGLDYDEWGNVRDELQQEGENKERKVVYRKRTDVSGDMSREVKDAVYELLVIDTLFHRGPMSDLVVGHAPNMKEDDEIDEDEQRTRKKEEKKTKEGKNPIEDRSHELVVCEGHGEHGAIAIVQPGVRAEEVTSISFNKGVIGCWTLYARTEQDDELEGETCGVNDRKRRREEEKSTTPSTSIEKRFHSYLVISTSTHTQIFSTGAEIAEVDAKETEYLCNTQTLLAANVFFRSRRLFAVQIHRTGIKLLDHGKTVAEINLEQELSDVKAAAVVDPFVLLLMVDGSLRVVTAREDTKPCCLEGPKRPELSSIRAKRGHQITRSLAHSENEAGGANNNFVTLPVSAMCVYKCTNRKSVKGIGSGSGVNNAKLFQYEEEERMIEGKKGTDGQRSLLNKSRIVVPEWLSSMDPQARVNLEQFLTDNQNETENDGRLSQWVRDQLKSDWGLTEAQTRDFEAYRTAASTAQPLSAEDLSAAIAAVTAAAPSALLGAQEDEEEEREDDEDREDQQVEKFLFGSDDDADDADDLFGVKKEEPENQNPNDKDENDKDENDNDEHDEEDEGSMRSVCALSRGGSLEIYSLPDFKLLWWCNDFVAGFEVLKSQVPNETQTPRATDEETKVVELCLTDLDDHTTTPLLMAFLSTGDLLLYKLYYCTSSAPNEHPLRMKRVSCAQIFRSPVSDQATFDPRFTKQHHKQNRLAAANKLLIGDKESQQYINRFAPFTNASGRRGVFIAGDNPMWLFMCRGTPRLHSFLMDNMQGDPVMRTQVPIDEIDIQSKEVMNKWKRGLVMCATPFHNENCVYGFLYFEAEGVLNIRTLPLSPSMKPRSLNMLPSGEESNDAKSEADASAVNELDTVSCDSEVTLRTVPLKATVRFAAYHLPTQTYAVVISKPVETLSMDMPTERSLPVYEDKYELLFFSPKTWEPMGRLDVFEPHEMVTCFCAVTLSGKSCLVLGTSNHQGEDVECRGRILVMEIYIAMGMDHVGGVQKKIKQKLLFHKVLQGPVTAVSSVDGFLVAGVGPLILMFEYNGEKLTDRVFFDTNLYIVSMQTFKNFVIYGDVYKSVYFLLWDPEIQQLTQIACDFRNLQVYSTSFLLDERRVGVVVTDAQKNLQIFRYMPRVPESIAGKRLLPRADFYVGAHINKMVALRMKQRYYSPVISKRINLEKERRSLEGILPSWPTHFGKHRVHEREVLRLQQIMDNRTSKSKLMQRNAKQAAHRAKSAQKEQLAALMPSNTNERVAMPLRTMCLSGTLDGGLGVLCPIDETIYRRLLALHTQMTYNLRHKCALNPRAYRLLRSPLYTKHLSNQKKVVDGKLVFQYPMLDLYTQRRLARKIGTSPAQIIDNLLQITRFTRIS